MKPMTADQQGTLSERQRAAVGWRYASDAEREAARHCAGCAEYRYQDEASPQCLLLNREAGVSYSIVTDHFATCDRYRAGYARELFKLRKYVAYAQVVAARAAKHGSAKADEWLETVRCLTARIDAIQSRLNGARW